MRGCGRKKVPEIAQKRKAIWQSMWDNTGVRNPGLKSQKKKKGLTPNINQIKTNPLAGSQFVVKVGWGREAARRRGRKTQIGTPNNGG